MDNSLKRVFNEVALMREMFQLTKELRSEFQMGSGIDMSRSLANFLKETDLMFMASGNIKKIGSAKGRSEGCLQHDGMLVEFGITGWLQQGHCHSVVWLPA